MKRYYFGIAMTAMALFLFALVLPTQSASGGGETSCQTSAEPPDDTNPPAEDTDSGSGNESMPPVDPDPVDPIPAPDTPVDPVDPVVPILPDPIPVDPIPIIVIPVPLPDPFPPDPGPALNAVPNVVGKSYVAAQQALTQAGLSIQATNSIGLGAFVYAQQIAPGTMVAPGTQVPVTLKVRVPDLHGKSYLQAKALLDQRKLIAQATNATPPKAYVFSQQIAANTEVFPDTPVQFTMKVKMPDVKNKNLDQIKNQIWQDYGLNLQTAQPSAPKAFIFTQQFAPGTELSPSTQVHVTLRVKLPNTAGMSYAAAKNLLQTQYGVIVQHGTGNIAKKVISSNPVAGTIMPTGNVVKLNTQP